MRAFIETGVSKLLGTTSEMVAMHKDGYVIPVKVWSMAQQTVSRTMLLCTVPVVSGRAWFRFTHAMI